MNQEIRKPLPSWSGDGVGREIAESFNLIARRLEAIGAEVPEITGGPGVRVKSERGRVVVMGVPRESGGGTAFAFPFQVTVYKDGEAWKAKIAKGTMNGAVCGETIFNVSADQTIYGDAVFASAYDETPYAAGVAVAANATVPKSHDTRWIVPIAKIISEGEGAAAVLKVEQYVVGALASRRLRPRKSFDVTREDSALRIAKGWITALTNPADEWTLNQEVAATTIAPQTGTLLLPVEVTAQKQDGEAPYTITVGELEFGEVDNTNRGLFVPLPIVEVTPWVCSTTHPLKYATGVLDGSAPMPTCGFKIPLADVAVDGDDWIITQRQCGDIQIPLAVNWGIPFAPTGT